MYSRNQYLKVLRERYLKVKSKKEKAQILNEYCYNTSQARKYVVRKIQPGVERPPAMIAAPSIIRYNVTVNDHARFDR